MTSGPPVQGDELLAQHAGDVVREPAPAVQQEVERRQGLDDLGAEVEVERAPAVGVEERPPAVHLPALARRRRRRDRAEGLVDLLEAREERRRVVERLGDLRARGLQSVELREATVAELGVADPLEHAAERHLRTRRQRQAEAPREPAALSGLSEDRRHLVGVGDEAGLDERLRDLPGGVDAVAAAQHLGDRGRHLDRRLARQDDAVALDANEAGPPRREPLRHSLLRGERLGEPRDRPVLEEDVGRLEQAVDRLEPRRLAARESHPADRPEEADRVVLDAVALPVRRDELLALAVLAVAGLARGAVEERLDPAPERMVVLPGDRRLELPAARDLLHLSLERRQLLGEEPAIRRPLLLGGVRRCGERVGAPGQLRRGEARDALGREAGRADEDVLPNPVLAAPQRNEVVAGRRRGRRLGRQGVRHAAVSLAPATSSASWPAEGCVKNTATGRCTPVDWWMS
jgi:hypothetical protein